MLKFHATRGVLTALILLGFTACGVTHVDPTIQVLKGKADQYKNRDAQINAISGLGVVVGSGAIDKSGTFRVDLNVDIDKADLSSLSETAETCPDVSVSDTTAGIISFELLQVLDHRRGDMLGRIFQRSNPDLYETGGELVLWIYVDKDVEIKGACPDKVDGIFDLDLRKGWNPVVNTVDISGFDLTNYFDIKPIPTSAAFTFFPTSASLQLILTGNGSGTIRSSPGQLDCHTGDSDCQVKFDAGTHVTLTAAADEGSLFMGWTGCDSSSNNSCEVEVISDGYTNIDARFELAVPLNISVVGDGSGRVIGHHIDCEGACTYLYPQGQIVNIEAIGLSFSGWEGCENYRQNNCYLRMDEPRNVIARF